VHGVQRLTRDRAGVLSADVALAVPVAAVMLAGTHFAAWRGGGRPIDTLAYCLVGPAVAAVAVRRSAPRCALALATAVAAGYLALGYPGGPIYLALPITGYTVGTRHFVRASLPAYAASAAALSATDLIFRPAGWSTGLTHALGWLLEGLAAWAVGALVRMRRESAAAARAERLREGAYQERLRTAQDVHDTVGHGLAAISLQAGVALHVLDRSPQRARELLEAIKASSQDALEELRVTLAVFRCADQPRGPAPGLDRLDVLVGRINEAGVPVELVRVGQPRAVSASVELAAYRIVQESLTNVVRHAGPGTAAVRLEYAADELRIEVTDTGRGAGAERSFAEGQGVTGMRTRADAVGGTLEVGPRPGGGFSVRARLPVAGS
jgi:signal transduction histidine kinase